VTRFTILGVPVDALTEVEAVDWVAQAIAEGRPRLVISVNPERIMHARRDPAFAAVLAARGADAGWRFYFLGGGPGVAEAAGELLRETYPGFILAGADAGSPDPASDDITTEAVRSSRAQVLLLAYGAASEEAWLARNLERSGAIIGLGVGGAFDFISGRTRRAPAWMRERGLEWLHRLSHQPWRWRRMLALPRFVVRVWVEPRRQTPDEGSP
jgi:N-acetylglucosaminyldiphosphoundecaprenol N-acetyl-beta-D-mannosaminyltransferase